GVGPGPAVVLDGGVQRLRGVPNVVSQPTRVKDRSLLHGRGVLVGGGELAILAQGGLQPLPDLRCLPGLQAYLLGTLPGRKDFGLKIEPTAGQGTERDRRLPVDEV